MILNRMILLGLATILPLSLPVNAKSFDGVSGNQVDAIQKAIKLSGYKCDTVDSIIPFNFSRGFSIWCNNFRYSYELADKGGRMVITVK